MNIRDVITLGDLDLLVFIVKEYRAQSEAIEKKGGVAGHSRHMENAVAALLQKLGGQVP